jgi:hypothetical protein
VGIANELLYWCIEKSALRVLLADVMPIFVQTLSLLLEWTVLKEQGIIDAFEGENLKEWLDSLNLLPKS